MIKMYIVLHVKYHLFLSDINETWIFSTDFRKIVRFHENRSSGSRVITYGRTDMTKLIIALRNFVNAPEKIVTFLIIPVTDILIGDIFVHTEVCEVATAVTYI